MAPPILDPACLADFNTTWGDIFERTFCYNTVVDFLNSSNVTTSSACMRALFIDGMDTNPDNPLLTYQGCQAMCGADWGYYTDAATRVFSWVVPVMNLLSNINLSPVERRVMMGIVHALGDPIDTLWSLLDKLYAWYICHQVARRAVEAARLAGGPRLHVEDLNEDGIELHTISTVQNKKIDRKGERSVQVHITAIDEPDTTSSHENSPQVPGPAERIRIIATVLGGFEELAGHEMTCPRAFYTKVISLLGNPAAEYISARSIPPATLPPSPSRSPSLSKSISNPHMIPNPSIDQWHSTALSLVDDRTNEFLRTGMAVFFYLVQVTSEFVDQISQNAENTPGGRIGAAMMLSWLIPVALLSNLLGGFPSRRSNLRPLLDLLNETLLPGPHREENPELTNLIPQSWDSYFHSQRQNGAIYGFRPHKTTLISHSTTRNPRDKLIRLSLPILATLPITASFTASFILHWEAVPSGFSCRHVWILTVFSLWLISPILTYLFTALPRSKTLGFWLTYTKDFIIGFGTISMIVASVIGLFNSCFCWSLALWLGEANAIMMVKTRGTYQEYKRGRYPALVGSFILMELGFVVLVAWWLWSGLGEMRWGEKNKRSGWDRLRAKDLRILYGFLNRIKGKV